MNNGSEKQSRWLVYGWHPGVSGCSSMSASSAEGAPKRTESCKESHPSNLHHVFDEQSWLSHHARIQLKTSLWQLRLSGVLPRSASASFSLLSQPTPFLQIDLICWFPVHSCCYGSASILCLNWFLHLESDYFCSLYNSVAFRKKNLLLRFGNAIKRFTLNSNRSALQLLQYEIKHNILILTVFN